MKILVTGGCGFIGSAVVRLAVASVGMTKEEADTRRKLEQLLIHAHPEVTEANAITGWTSRCCVC